MNMKVLRLEEILLQRFCQSTVYALSIFRAYVLCTAELSTNLSDVWRGVHNLEGTELVVPCTVCATMSQ
jgi:hypothetical protein